MRARVFIEDIEFTTEVRPHGHRHHTHTHTHTHTHRHTHTHTHTHTQGERVIATIIPPCRNTLHVRYAYDWSLRGSATYVFVAMRLHTLCHARINQVVGTKKKAVCLFALIVKEKRSKSFRRRCYAFGCAPGEVFRLRTKSFFALSLSLSLSLSCSLSLSRSLFLSRADDVIGMRG